MNFVSNREGAGRKVGRKASAGRETCRTSCCCGPSASGEAPASRTGNFLRTRLQGTCAMVVRWEPQRTMEAVNPVPSFDTCSGCDDAPGRHGEKDGSRVFVSARGVGPASISLAQGCRLAQASSPQRFAAECQGRLAVSFTARSRPEALCNSPVRDSPRRDECAETQPRAGRKRIFLVNATACICR
jgi:hypothetical protein